MEKINIQKIVESWSPAVEQLSKGAVKGGSDRMEWICQLAHNQKMHALYEGADAVGGVSSPLSTLNNTQGIGNAVPAQAAGMTAAEQTAQNVKGSGDKWPVFLPMAVQVAARTIGFDLVNVTPLDGPTGVIPFLDYVYSDGKEPYGATPAYNSATANPQRGWKQGTSEKAYSQFGTPAAFKAIITEILDPSAGSKREIAKKLVDAGKITLTGHGSSKIDVEFIALSRLTADPMFKVLDASTATLGEVFAEDTEVTISGICKIKNPRLISMLEDQIQGYTGAGKYDTDRWTGTFQNPFHLYEPMDRATGETQMPRHLSLEVRTQFVQVGKIQTAVSVTREQVQDLQKQWGIDVLKMVENAAINELTQTINKHILSRLFALGWKNHVQAYEAEGLNLNMSFGDEDTSIAFATYDNGQEIHPSMIVPKMTVYGQFENQDTRYARVARLVKTAGNVIMQRGRRGPANFAVTNYKIASMLQDQAQYTFAPLANTFNQNNGQLYPLGTVAGITVYVDPLMRNDDTRVLVGRKGEKDEPGVHFCPYLMAESVNFINPATMSPKVVVSSRYALVDVGWYPQTQYLTLFINAPEFLY